MLERPSGRFAVYACPCCHRKTFSFWQKQSLGPHRSLKCSACKREVSVPWVRAQFAFAPMVVLMFLGLIAAKIAYGMSLEVLMGGGLGFMVGAILATPIYHFYVPLIPQQRA